MADQHESIDLGGPTVDSSAAAVRSWFPSPPPPIYSCTLTPELVAKAREELQEKPEWRLRDVQALRDMILKVGQNNDALQSRRQKLESFRVTFDWTFGKNLRSVSRKYRKEFSVWNLSVCIYAKNSQHAIRKIISSFIRHFSGHVCSTGA